MTPLATAALANRFLQPLSHPWAVLSAGVLPTDPRVLDAFSSVVHIAMRLLHLLLAL
jgi:hypothetical protein